MQLKVTSLNKEAIQLQIDGEDYSVCDIIHKELLNLKHVKFAGVAPPHPLIKTMTVQFHTDGAEGNKVLSEAVDNARKKIDELLELANKTFPQPVRAPQEAVRAEPVRTEVVEREPAVVESSPNETPTAAAP